MLGKTLILTRRLILREVRGLWNMLPPDLLFVAKQRQASKVEGFVAACSRRITRETLWIQQTVLMWLTGWKEHRENMFHKPQVKNTVVEERWSTHCTFVLYKVCIVLTISQKAATTLSRGLHVTSSSELDVICNNPLDFGFLILFDQQNRLFVSNAAKQFITQKSCLHLCPGPAQCCSGKVLVWMDPGSPSGHGCPSETKRWSGLVPRPLRWFAYFPPIMFL